MRIKAHINVGLLVCNTVDLLVDTNVLEKGTASTFRDEDEYSMSPQSVGIYLQIHMVLQLRGPISTYQYNRSL
jgi:hypothetical protein